MALNAMQIFQVLPKSNCGKCGFPTCLAFAMQLANAKVTLAACTEISDDARAQLEGAAAPPIRKVTVGAGPLAVEMGDETELFRHDKKFFHPTAFCYIIPDDDFEKVKEKAEFAKGYEFERVGQKMRMDMVAVQATAGDEGKFVEAVKESGADVIGMSALLTTTMVEMKGVIEALEEAGLRGQVKVIIGGAPVTQKFSDEIGADGYAPNASAAVETARALLGK